MTSPIDKILEPFLSKSGRNICENPIDTVEAQIGIPSSLTVRICKEHGKFLVPKRTRFKCPDCQSLNSIPDGTGGNGDTALVNEAKVDQLNAEKLYIYLGM